MPHQALYYKKEGEKIRCLLCPRECLIAAGGIGACHTRRERDGELHVLNYGRVAALNLDPVEKKPLYHFYPGKPILSVGTCGCNLFCSFCQNWSLARGEPGQVEGYTAPEEILRILEREGGPDQVPAVAYTYNEPLTWYEYVYDTARLLQSQGYRNVLVTNGYISPEPLCELLPFIDAMNIDLKAFSDSFYRDYCRGRLEPVLSTIATAVKAGHVEVTCLLIPGLNDEASEQEALAAYLGGLSPDLVLHYSRYFPQYKLELPPTSPEKMQEAVSIARKHLRYVYAGNINLPGASNTLCPYCGNLLIERSSYRTRVCGLSGRNCSRCDNRISIVRADS